MTYTQLKAFCNSLTEKQLQQEVYLAQVDDAAIKIERAHVSTEDTYFDHCDGLGTLEEIMEQYPEDWLDVIDGATRCPAGTVMLLNE